MFAGWVSRLRCAAQIPVTRCEVLVQSLLLTATFTYSPLGKQQSHTLSATLIMSRHIMSILLLDGDHEVLFKCLPVHLFCEHGNLSLENLHYNALAVQVP